MASANANGDVVINCTSASTSSTIASAPRFSIEAKKDAQTWEFAIAYVSGASARVDECASLSTAADDGEDVTTRYRTTNGRNSAMLCGDPTRTDCAIAELEARARAMEATHDALATSIAAEVSTYDAEYVRVSGYRTTEESYVNATFNVDGEGWRDFGAGNANPFAMTYATSDGGLGGTTGTFTFSQSQTNVHACGDSSGDNHHYVTFSDVGGVRRLRCVLRDVAWSI